MYQTALHWTAKRGYSRMLKLLLDYGGDPNATDLMGRTPLFLAAHHSHLICAKLLISYGVNPLLVSDTSKDLLDYTPDPYIRNQLKKAVKVIDG